MLNLKFLTGMGTALLILAFYCFKAALQKPVAGAHNPHLKPLTKKEKSIWLTGGFISLAGGIFFLVKAIKLI